MPEATYDVVTVGGGLGGGALAAAMAQAGARVLVLERERRFQDRVRGEVLAPWGVAEAEALGLLGALRTSCGHDLPWFDTLFGGALVSHRDVRATTAQAVPWLAFYHPAMQETALEAAARAGAEIRRGVRVRGVEPGAPAMVVTEGERIAARLVVGVDGRSSTVRQWAGFTTRRDPERLFFSGVLLDDVATPEDTACIAFNPMQSRISLVFPQGGGRARAYAGWHKDAAPEEAGRWTVAPFVAAAAAAGFDPQVFAAARPAGPLAVFSGADCWVDHPYRDGVALIGDAAATSDPTWGQGMSLTLRDARVLRDALLAGGIPDGAADYAREHDRYYGAVHIVEGWFTDVLMDVGPAADERRMRALPLLAEDDTRFPDLLFSGPEVATDEQTRRRFFGEE